MGLLSPSRESFEKGCPLFFAVNFLFESFYPSLIRFDSPLSIPLEGPAHLPDWLKLLFLGRNSLAWKHHFLLAISLFIYNEAWSLALATKLLECSCMILPGS